MATDLHATASPNTDDPMVDIESVPLIDPLAEISEINSLKDRVATLEAHLSVIAIAVAALARASGGMPVVTTAMDRILDGQMDAQNIRDLIEANRAAPTSDD